MTDREALHRRVRAQGLAGPGATSVVDAVRAAGALQAQDTRASRLAVRCRSRGLDAPAVKRACGEERSVVRTWLMRGTLHMVPAEDAGWMAALLGPRFAAGDRGRRLQLGLDDDTCARALPAIRESLEGGRPLSRGELVSAVRARGVAVDPAGQAGAHLVAYAAAAGLVCRGPEREDDEPTYVLLDEWAGRHARREADAALAELTLRYVSAHGPATAGDYACWAGIGVGLARRGFGLVERHLERVEVAGEAAWMPAGTDTAGGDAAPVVRLLPAFDAYLLAYRARDLALPRRFARRVQAGGGWIHPVLVVDGTVVGTWRLEAHGRASTVVLAPFERLDEAIRPALEAEAADVGRFLAREIDLAVTDPG